MIPNGNFKSSRFSYRQKNLINTVKVTFLFYKVQYCNPRKQDYLIHEFLYRNYIEIHISLIKTFIVHDNTEQCIDDFMFILINKLLFNDFFICLAKYVKNQNPETYAKIIKRAFYHQFNSEELSQKKTYTDLWISLNNSKQANVNLNGDINPNHKKRETSFARVNWETYSTLATFIPTTASISILLYPRIIINPCVFANLLLAPKCLKYFKVKSGELVTANENCLGVKRARTISHLLLNIFFVESSFIKVSTSVSRLC